MRYLRKARVSPALAVATIALIVALAGTSIAKVPIGFVASALGLNSKQKKQVTTIADTEIKHKAGGLSVKNAKHATSASSATTATSATTAKTATTAVNAAELDGQPATAFEPSADFFRSGLVTAASGQTVPIVSFGSFALSLVCTAGGGGAVDASITATSSVADALGAGVQLTAGVPATILDTGSGTTFNEDDNNVYDFLAPGKAYQADTIVGQNAPGIGACFADVTGRLG